MNGKTAMIKEVWKKFDETELSHSSVHHLMAVHHLVKENGYARAVDIGRYLNLTRGSISVTLHKLIDKDYLEEDENKFYRLSEKGEHLVCSVLSKRQILKQFFTTVLRLPEDSAEIDACKIEHLLSQQAGEQLLVFMGYFLSDNSEAAAFREGFQQFQYNCPMENCLICDNNCYFANSHTDCEQ